MQIQDSLSQSILLAMRQPELSRDYVRMHAQEMDPQIQQQHISLYVNEYSVDLGERGKAAIRYLLEQGNRSGLLPAVKDSIFLNDSMHVV
jgi:1,4-dihydroxy-6-naphthoate synthase